MSRPPHQTRPGGGGQGGGRRLHARRADEQPGPDLSCGDTGSGRNLRARCARRARALLVLGLGACDSGTGPDSEAPVALVVEAGAEQVAAAGEPVAVEPSVKAVAASGAGVAGVAVTFRVVQGGGSVASQSAATGADGTAAAGRWTLGAKGRQRLEAAAAGLDPVFFSAGAAGDPAAIVVVAGDGQAAEVASATPTAPAVRVLEADGEPAPFVLVTFAADQGSVGQGQVYTDDAGRASPGVWRLGPAAGPQRLLAGVAGSGIANNPVVFRATATPALPAQFALRPGAAEPEVDRYYWPPATLRVTDVHGNGVPWVAVGVEASGGGRVMDSVVYTDGRGVAVVDRWVMGPTAGARNALTATILSVGSAVTGASATIAAAPEAADFDIEVLHLPEPVPALVAALDDARATWQSVVEADVLGLFWRRETVARCFSDDEAAWMGLPARFVIDDHLVFSVAAPLDGPGGTLARSGWCWALTDEGEVWPAISVVVFDAADVPTLSAATLADLARHQLAHALGFGTTLWRGKDLLGGAVGAPSGLYFTGSEALSAFKSLGGSVVAGAGTPLDPVSEAEGNLHWRASVFGPELLTEVVRAGGPNPLSVVTLATMRDAGYRDVDLSVADDYALPGPSAGGAGLPTEAATRWLWLGDDGLALPRRVLDAKTGAVSRAGGPDRPTLAPWAVAAASGTSPANDPAALPRASPSAKPAAARRESR